MLVIARVTIAQLDILVLRIMVVPFLVVSFVSCACSVVFTFARMFLVLLVLVPVWYHDYSDVRYFPYSQHFQFYCVCSSRSYFYHLCMLWCLFFVLLFAFICVRFVLFLVSSSSPCYSVWSVIVGIPILSELRIIVIVVRLLILLLVVTIRIMIRMNTCIVASIVIVGPGLFVSVFPYPSYI